MCIASLLRRVVLCKLYCLGDVALGVSAVVDSRTGTLGKYAVAAQVKAEEHTLAASLADMDTVKASWVMAVGASHLSYGCASCVLHFPHPSHA